jgi:3-isopropylmalate/(R)-2-methylmalate dehydratase small subunit
MNSIDIVKGSGVPVRGNDIDTDRIIPARFLKCVTFEGLGDNAFADDIAGLAAQGKVHPFRDPAYKNGSILVSNQNFGCGSSREHAPQALKRWGIRAIIAESYSEIFFGNCVAIGVPCYKVSHEVADKILSWIEAHPSEELVTSTESRTLKMGDSSSIIAKKAFDWLEHTSYPKASTINPFSNPLDEARMKESVKAMYSFGVVFNESTLRLLQELKWPEKAIEMIQKKFNDAANGKIKYRDYSESYFRDHWKIDDSDLNPETIELTLADGPRGQFLDGSWHARSALMANADKVQELASKLPYMNFLK